jgi:hypothetical protein
LPTVPHQPLRPALSPSTFGVYLLPGFPMLADNYYGAHKLSGLDSDGPLELHGQMPEGVDLRSNGVYGTGVVATEPFKAGSILYDVSALLIPEGRVGERVHESQYRCLVWGMISSCSCRPREVHQHRWPPVGARH